MLVCKFKKTEKSYLLSLKKLPKVYLRFIWKDFLDKFILLKLQRRKNIYLIMLGFQIKRDFRIYSYWNVEDIKIN